MARPGDTLEDVLRCGLAIALAAAVAALGCGRVGFEILRATGAGDGGLIDGGLDGDIPSADITHRIAIGVEGTVGDYVYIADYAASATAADAVRNGTAIEVQVGGSSLRALAPFTGDLVMVGSSLNTEIKTVNVATRTLVTPPTAVVIPSLSNLHALCALPDRHVVAGEYTGGTGARVGEYTLSPVETIRSVYTTTVDSGTLGMCVSAGSAVLISDEDADGDSDGDIVRLELELNDWVETRRFDISQFDTLEHPDHGTGIFAFAVVGASVFGLPIRRRSGQLTAVIECPLATLDACNYRGQLPPDLDPAPNGRDTIMGAGAVPGTLDQFLFVSNSGLYRYQLGTDTYELLVPTEDIPLSGGTTIEAVENLRHVVVLAIP